MAIQFKTVKNVTLPLLKTKDDGTPIYVRITGEIVQAKENEAVRKRAAAEGKEAEKPPMIAPVVNLETGEEAQIIVGSVLHAELESTYPAQAYVGKNFSIAKFKPSGTKRYATYQIAEVEVVSDEAPKAPAASDTPAADAPAATGKGKGGK